MILLELEEYGNVLYNICVIEFCMFLWPGFSNMVCFSFIANSYWTSWWRLGWLYRFVALPCSAASVPDHCLQLLCLYIVDGFKVKKSSTHFNLLLFWYEHNITLTHTTSIFSVILFFFYLILSENLLAPSRLSSFDNC